MKNPARTIKYAVIYLLGIFWAIVSIYPLIFTLMSSFKNNDEIFSATASPLRMPDVFRVENYTEALVTGNMARSLLNSFFLAAMSTMAVLLAASMVAFVISRYKYKIGGLIYMYFVLGIMIPIHATLVPLMKTVNFIQGHNNYIVLIAIYAAFNLPLAILIITGNMRVIPRSIDESAHMDGCTPLRLFISLIMPLSAPALATVGIITFLYVYNDLLFGVMFLSKNELHTISLGMQTFVGSKITTYGPIFASIIISMVPMITIYLFFQSKVEAGLTAGAVKE
jgi:raffinose/stachyose/melibiose transport system permease protein